MAGRGTVQRMRRSSHGRHRDDPRMAHIKDTEEEQQRFGLSAFCALL